jgi:ubiquinone/menaquinone biosynthesis C-methylase UbiE
MKLSSYIKTNLQIMLRPKGKQGFLSTLDSTSRILDVGCGNHKSVSSFKMVLPDCIYTGIDVGDYNQTSDSLSQIDEYIVTASSTFPSKIASLGNRFDAVVSSHNLEHCDNRNQCLDSIMKVVVKGGSVYLSFPSEKSIGFPRRSGTLNYYDDDTHQDSPPDFEAILEELKNNNFNVTFSAKYYKPFILRFIGFIMEPISMVTKRISIGTWDYYGFESIIHATKVS